KDLGEGGRIEGRTIGGNTSQRQVTRGQGRFQPTQKHPDVVVGGIVIQDVIEEPFVATIIDGGENAEGTIIEFIGGHGARKIGQRPSPGSRGPCVPAPFFPQPRPSSESWRRGQTRGGRATGANSLGGRAGRLRPPAGPPDPSRGGCTERRVVPDQR